MSAGPFCTLGPEQLFGSQHRYCNLMVLYPSAGAANSKDPSGHLKQQKLIFPQFWTLDVQDQGVSRLVSSEASFLCS